MRTLPIYNVCRCVHVCTAGPDGTCIIHDVDTCTYIQYNIIVIYEIYMYVSQT